MKTREHLSAVIIIPVVLLVILAGFTPFVSAAADSFFHDYSGKRSFAGFDNFRLILTDRAFFYSLNITVLWAFLNVLFSLVFGFLIALGIVQSRKDSSLLYRTLLIPWGIPIYIAVPLWRAFLHGNGGESVITRFTGLKINLMMDPVSGFLGALAVSLWLSIPLSAFVFAGHMRKVQRQVIEAARIDGAGEGDIALHIYIPAIRESLLAMGVLNFIKAFKEFTLVFLMTAGGPPLVSGITERHIVGATTTIGVFLYDIFLQTNDFGVSSAYSLVITAFVALIMIVWVFAKRDVSVIPILILSGLAQVPGGTPVLLLIGAGYLFAVYKPNAAVPVFIFHILYLFIRICRDGFLQGFHPGILLPAAAVLVLFHKKRKVRAMRRIPLYRWNGLHFLRFYPKNGMQLFSALSSGIFVFLTAVIFYMLFWMSLSKISACYVDSFFPAMATARNYIDIFKNEGILRFFLNTLFLSAVTALLLPVFVFPAAVWLSRIGKKKSLAFLGLLQILATAGGMHTLIPLYRMFLRLGVVNTYIPLVFIYLYHALPLSLFILSAYLETIPGSFRDLALLEGMGVYAYTFRILLPLSLPPLVTSVMAAFIGSWNGFQAPLLFLNDERLYPISLKLYGYVGSLGSGTPVWNLFAAASVVNTLIIGFLFIRFKSPFSLSPIGEGAQE